MPLRGADFYTDQQIELRVGAEVSELDVQGRSVHVKDRRFPFGALLIATGAEPVRLPVPGSDAAHVHYLRSMADSKAIIAKAAAVKQAVVIGASFIGLEVAASLRVRGIAVHAGRSRATADGKNSRPGSRRVVQHVHESHGVTFHLGRSVTRIEASRVVLDDGDTIEAPMVIVGIGVRPRLALAERARSRSTAASWSTSISKAPSLGFSPRATWHDGPTRTRVNVFVSSIGSWRNGRARPPPKTCWGVAAASIWSVFLESALRRDSQLCRSRGGVGHYRHRRQARSHDCRITYRRHERPLAVATIFRDRESLETELAMERGTFTA